MNEQCEHRILVICKQIELVYDNKVIFDYKRQNIQEYLTQNNKFKHSSKMLNPIDLTDINNIKQIIENMVKTLKIKQNILTIIDRRGTNDILYVTQYDDIKDLADLYCNYFIGMLFKHNSNGTNQAYLTYGVKQSLRFYPEHLTSIIPKLFSNTSSKSTAYQHLFKLYSTEYKNGFSLNLNDDIFNRYYKRITSFDHVSVNYNRSTIKTVQFEFAKDDEKINEYNCNEYNVLNIEDCPQITYIIESLKVFQTTNYKNNNNKNTNNIKKQETSIKAEYLSKAYDHIIIEHKFCLNREHRTKIQEFVRDKVGECKYKNQCYVLDQHASRKREITQRNNIVHDHDIDDILTATLNSLHSYLIHGDKELFRLRNDDKNAILRFTTTNTWNNSESDVFCVDSFYLLLNNKGMADIDIYYFKQWVKENDYDSESLLEDINDGRSASNIYYYMKRNKINDKHFNSIYIELVDQFNTNLLSLYLLKNNMNKSVLLQFTNWCDHNEYDSDSMQQDLENDDKESNLFQYFQQKGLQSYCSLIKNKFIKSSAFKTTDKKSLKSINLGVSVLKWLKYDEDPTFANLKDEILHNKHSTINEQLYNDYIEECKIKIKNHASKYYKLNEILSLKLYTDTTAFQSALRRSHWESVDKHDLKNKENKRSFYWWSSWLYRASLFHCKPLPRFSSDDNTPCNIFHGLNDIFTIDQRRPLYNGPISTTLEQSVAHQFSAGVGLLWTLKGSYINPYQIVLGIQMDWISHFKSESEVLLVNQYLPIQSTRNFERNMENQVNQFMRQLQEYKDKITNKHQQKLFYKQIGLKYSKQWFDIIWHHKLLCAKCEHYEEISVIQRLVDELHINEFADFCQIFCKSGFVDNLQLDDNKAIILANPQQINTEFHKDIIQSKYLVIDGEMKDNEDKDICTFDDKQHTMNDIHFLIPFNMQFSVCSIYAQLKNDDHYILLRKFEIKRKSDKNIENKIDYLFDLLQLNYNIKQIGFMMQSIDVQQILKSDRLFELTKEMEIRTEDRKDNDEDDNKQNMIQYQHTILHRLVRSINELNLSELSEIVKVKGHQYIFEDEIRINSQLIIDRTKNNKNNRVIQIFSKKGIFIDKNGALRTDGCGYDFWLNKEEISTISQFGFAAERILIELISCGSIINEGVISCSGIDGGFGGSIKIMANNKFINNGSIKANNSGNIHISCNSFEDNNDIEPKPNVEIVNEPINFNKNIFTNVQHTDITKINLKYYKHHGHYHSDYHPINMLSDNDQYYLSKGIFKMKNNRDWITFEMNDLYKIKAIKIKNDPTRCAVKSMLLSIGNDNNEWYPLQSIKNMKQNKDQKSLKWESFEINSKISDSKILSKQLRLIKIEFEDNYGDSWYMCYGFEIYGIKIDNQ